MRQLFVYDFVLINFITSYVYYYCPGEDIKKKWKNLRDTYTKHLRSQAGHLAAKNYKNWPWAKHMDFVKPFQSSVNNAANNAQKEKDAKTMKCESMESAEEHAATFDELQLPEFDEVG